MRVLGYGRLSWVLPTFTKAKRFQGCLRATFLLGMDLSFCGERGFGRFSNILPILILPVSHSAYLISDENQYSLHPMDRDASEVREILQ